MANLGSMYGTNNGGSNTLVIDFSNVQINGTITGTGVSQPVAFRATSTNASNFTFTGGKQLLSSQLENVIGNKGSFNIGGAYNPATGLFTAPEDGVYSFYGSVFWQTSAFNAGYITSYISTPTTSTVHPTNYALLISQYGANEPFNANFVQIVSGIVSLTAGDSIGLYVFANNETLTANVSRQYSYFCGHRV